MARRTSVRPALAAAFVVSFLCGAFAYRPVERTAAAVSLLVHLADPPSRGEGLRVDATSLTAGGASVPARLYVPGRRPTRCTVLAHGVHYKGIAEPRLVRFASEMARAGVVVLTPELSDLADYRITTRGVEVLGAAVHALHERCRAIGDGKVGLVGFSFAGGLSLVAAEDPAVGSQLAYVASVGGHTSLSRVMSFLLTGSVVTPHGIEHRVPHEYGLVVLLYDYLPAFVPEEDLPVMKAAVHAWLTEDRPLAWSFASRRTTAGAEELFMQLQSGKIRELGGALLARIEKDRSSLELLSPSGRLDRILPPVYVLHGTGDSVIPPEETRWADRELAGHAHLALVTPLIEHVELGHVRDAAQAVALVRFVARLL